MAGPSLKELLTEWTIWLFKQDNNDAASDTTEGSVVDAQNRDRRDRFWDHIWFIPGTWGMVLVPPRKITVPEGTKLFIVAASSHATPRETPTGKSLKKHAEDIDSKWFAPVLFAGPVGGDLTPVSLTTVTTDKFQVDINANNPYRTVSGGVSGNGIDMVTVGRVKLFTPPAHKKTRLTIAAQSPEVEIDGKKERQYNVQVDYLVTVP
jgi:hypothetical protein